MNCPQCAANMSETAKVCGYCGTRLHTAAPTSDLAPSQDLTPGSSPSPNPSSLAAPSPAATTAAGAAEPGFVDPSTPPPATFEAATPVAAPATDGIDSSLRLGPIKGSLRWVATAGLVILAILAIDLFSCSFGFHEYVSGDGLCDQDLAGFWVFTFAPAVLLAGMMRLGSHKRRKTRLFWQALVAAAGVALSVWAVIFYDATYYCAGTISGGPHPESDSTFCAIEWGRVAAFVAVGLVFVASFVAAMTDRNRRRRAG